MGLGDGLLVGSGVGTPVVGIAVVGCCVEGCGVGCIVGDTEVGNGEGISVRMIVICHVNEVIIFVIQVQTQKVGYLKVVKYRVIMRVLHTQAQFRSSSRATRQSPPSVLDI